MLEHTRPYWDDPAMGLDPEYTPMGCPASAREVNAIPTHALHGLAHLPVHPLLLTCHAFSPLGSFV
eukprot:8639839-Pyramimonas_sp.AAC.1